MIRSLRHHLLPTIAGVLLFAGVSSAQIARSYQNQTPIAIPASGASTPYGTQVTVSNIVGTVTNVTVGLMNVTHANPGALRLILRGPSGQTVALNDATPRPGESPTTSSRPLDHVDVYFRDGSGQLLSNVTTPNAFVAPYSRNGAGISLPAPAPAMPYPPQLGTFFGSDPNGVWTLFVADQSGQATGTIAGGWLLTIESAESNRPMDVTTSVGPSTNYGSAITVSNLKGAIKNVTVSLYNVSHTYPEDLDVLLQAPSGKTVLLMSNAGGGTDINVAHFTFSDSAPTAIPDSGPLVDGSTYKPASYPPARVLPAPAPAAPYGTTLANLLTGDANGQWKLFVYDHSPQDGGTVGGWSLHIETAGGFAFAPEAATVTEGITYNFSVARIGGATGTVGATFGTGAVCESTPGVDFTLPPALLSFATGQTQRNLSIPTINDVTPELPESCYLQLTNATGGAALGSNEFGFLIEDDDMGLWTIAPAVGLVTGGTLTKLQVTNAQAGGTLLFDNAAATIQKIERAYSNVFYVYAFTPPHAAGKVTLKFTNPNQQSASMANAYTYVDVPANSSVDTDGDGMPDAWELQYGLNPLDPKDALADDDSDGRSNLDEFKQGTHPRGFFKRYLAEGASGGFFKTSIALVNVDAVAANVVYEFQKSDGSVTPFATLVDAMRRTTLDPATVLGGGEFSTMIESDREIVVDRTMIWPADDPYGSHIETSIAAPGKKWFLAEGATNADMDLFYLLQNPGDNAATVQVQYDLPAPQAPIVKSYAVPAHSRLTVHVNGEDPALAWNDIAAEISANQPIIVERSMYRTGNGRTWDAGHEGAAVRSPQSHWFFAEGATGNFFDLFLLLMNPMNQDANVQVSYLLTSGEVVIKTYPVSAHARRTIYVDMEDPKLANAAVSMVVDSDQLIVAERAMWWPDQIWYEAHDAAGANEPGFRWAVAEGEDGGGNNTQTYILIANTSTFAGSATVTLLFEDGTQATKTFPIAATSRFNVAVGAEFAEAHNRRFSAVVQSVDTGSGLPEIVVERSVYADGAGLTWNLGGSSLGTKLQ